MAVGIVLNRRRQVPAEDTPAFGAIAERFRRGGDLERAVQLCREGLQKFPDHLSARVTLGWALLDLGKYDEAQAALEQVLKRAPDNLAAIRGLAELHQRAESSVELSLDGPGPWPPDAATIEAAAAEDENIAALSEELAGAAFVADPPAARTEPSRKAKPEPASEPAIDAKVAPKQDDRIEPKIDAPVQGKVEGKASKPGKHKSSKPSKKGSKSPADAHDVRQPEIEIASRGVEEGVLDTMIAHPVVAAAEPAVSAAPSPFAAIVEAIEAAPLHLTPAIDAPVAAVDECMPAATTADASGELDPVIPAAVEASAASFDGPLRADVVLDEELPAPDLQLNAELIAADFVATQPVEAADVADITAAGDPAVEAAPELALDIDDLAGLTELPELAAALAAPMEATTLETAEPADAFHLTPFEAAADDVEEELAEVEAAIAAAAIEAARADNLALDFERVPDPIVEPIVEAIAEPPAEAIAADPIAEPIAEPPSEPIVEAVSDATVTAVVTVAAEPEDVAAPAPSEVEASTLPVFEATLSSEQAQVVVDDPPVAVVSIDAEPFSVPAEASALFDAPSAPVDPPAVDIAPAEVSASVEAVAPIDVHDAAESAPPIEECVVEPAASAQVAEAVDPTPIADLAAAPAHDATLEPAMAAAPEPLPDVHFVSFTIDDDVLTSGASARTADEFDRETPAAVVSDPVASRQPAGDIAAAAVPSDDESSDDDATDDEMSVLDIDAAVLHDFRLEADVPEAIALGDAEGDDVDLDAILASPGPPRSLRVFEGMLRGIAIRRAEIAAQYNHQ
jgi:hypothetical protein